MSLKYAIRPVVATGSALALLYATLVLPSQIVVVNGERRFVPTMDEEVTISLEDELEGKLPPIPRNEFVDMYRTSKRWSTRSFTRFVDTDQVEPIARALLEKVDGDKIEYIKEVLKFINENIQYTADTRGYHNPPLFGEDARPANYGKFPLQILHDKGGDCEEFSILASSFFAFAGIETGIAYSDNHAAVGFTLDDQDGLDRIVFGAVDSAIDGKVESTLRVHGNVSRFNATKTSTMSELEEAVAKAPLVIGERLNYPIDVLDWKFQERKPSKKCDKSYWNGDFTVTYIQKKEFVGKPTVINMGRDHTVGDMLLNATRLRESKTTLTEIYYRLPSDPTTYLLVRPATRLNTDSECETAGSGFGAYPVAAASDVAQLKRRRVFYLEPQQTGFTLHSKIPSAVRWEPLPAEKYPAWVRAVNSR